MTPAILKEIELLSLPITFIEYTIRNTDSISHNVQIYYDNSADPVVSNSSEEVIWSLHEERTLHYLKIGTEAQKFNGNNGADRINWGNFYVMTENDTRYFS